VKAAAGWNAMPFVGDWQAAKAASLEQIGKLGDI
jgi:hypothetical protein